MPSGWPGSCGCVLETPGLVLPHLHTPRPHTPFLPRDLGWPGKTTFPRSHLPVCFHKAGSCQTRMKLTACLTALGSSTVLWFL